MLLSNVGNGLWLQITKTVFSYTTSYVENSIYFAFLALLVDGADLMLLSYSLNSIKADFGLSSVQAGMLGSFISRYGCWWNFGDGRAINLVACALWLFLF